MTSSRLERVLVVATAIGLYVLALRLVLWVVT